MDEKKGGQQKLPARYKIGIAVTNGALVVAIVLGLGFALGWFGGETAKGSAAAGDTAVTGAAVTGTTANVEATTAEEEKTALEQEFEDRHTVGRLEDIAISTWLDKWGISYTTNAKGEIIVKADRTIKTIYYACDQARTTSAKRAGLSQHPISDAPEFVFADLSREDVEKILEAEKRGNRAKVGFSKEKIKDLVAQDVRTMISNVVLGIGHAEQIGGLYFGRSKTVYELSSAVRYLVDETDKAFEEDGTGYSLGMNRWVEKKGKHWYVTQDYLANIIPVVNQIVDGAEKSVEVTYADYNWGLKRGDSAQLRRLEPSTKADPLTAIVYKHYFKDGTLMEEPATNVRDRRPEIPSTPKVVKKAAKRKEPPAPSSTAKPGYNPEPDTKDKADPSVSTRVKPVKTPTPAVVTPAPTAPPTWTFVPYVTPRPTPIGTKQPDAIPTRRPNDDPGPGEPEATPTVPKSPSEEVEGSQYQPIASPQTGGTSTPRESVVNNPTATTAPGGQIVTDPHNGNERIENDQASTDPIDQRPSDTGSREGNSNSAFPSPD